MPIDEEDKDVVVTLDDPASDKTPEELAAEREIDKLVAADKAGQPEPAKDKPADKPLTAEEGKDDLAAQLKAMEATAAAERKARELAAGRVQWKRWIHPDDAPTLTEYADKLARNRARAEQKAG
jgi:predicted phage tail protein